VPVTPAYSYRILYEIKPGDDIVVLASSTSAGISVRRRFCRFERHL
jgi:hypothetical protein